LICGVNGQDGAYLARLLLDKGYVVVGTSRDASTSTFNNLIRLGVRDKVQTASLAANDFRSVLATLKRYAPDEVYNLAGQSSVGLSFEQPVETIESIVIGTLNFLEAIRFIERPMRFYNAGSGECFGDTRDRPAAEDSAFHPRSPYAVAKASAHGLVANYREAYGVFASTGILFNHESPLRSERFVTRKIISAAARISAGSAEKLRLGNLGVQRDWGWAPDYVEAMWRIMRQDVADDFVIATGRTTSLKHFVSRVFECFGLDWNKYIEIDEGLLRPADIEIGRANPAKAYEVLGWKSTRTVEDVIKEMCDAERLAVS
jgi:GDPmannose 4,6-dehydratase